MPSTSPAQQHVANMAKAVQHGKLALKDIPEGARAAVESMAKMTSAQLEGFQHLAPKRKTLLTGRK